MARWIVCFLLLCGTMPLAFAVEPAAGVRVTSLMLPGHPDLTPQAAFSQPPDRVIVRGSAPPQSAPDVTTTTLHQWIELGATPAERGSVTVSRNNYSSWTSYTESISTEWIGLGGTGAAWVDRSGVTYPRGSFPESYRILRLFRGNGQAHLEIGRDWLRHIGSDVSGYTAQWHHLMAPGGRSVSVVRRVAIQATRNPLTGEVTTTQTPVSDSLFDAVTERVTQLTTGTLAAGEDHLPAWNQNDGAGAVLAVNGESIQLRFSGEMMAWGQPLPRTALAGGEPFSGVLDGNALVLATRTNGGAVSLWRQDFGATVATRLVDSAPVGLPAVPATRSPLDYQRIFHWHPSGWVVGAREWRDAQSLALARLSPNRAPVMFRLADHLVHLREEVHGFSYHWTPNGAVVAAIVTQSPGVVPSFDWRVLVVQLASDGGVWRHREVLRLKGRPLGEASLTNLHATQLANGAPRLFVTAHHSAQPTVLQLDLDSPLAPAEVTGWIYN